MDSGDYCQDQHFIQVLWLISVHFLHSEWTAGSIISVGLSPFLKLHAYSFLTNIKNVCQSLYWNVCQSFYWASFSISDDGALQACFFFSSKRETLITLYYINYSLERIKRFCWIPCINERCFDHTVNYIIFIVSH